MVSQHLVILTQFLKNIIKTSLIEKGRLADAILGLFSILTLYVLSLSNPIMLSDVCFGDATSDSYK